MTTWTKEGSDSTTSSTATVDPFNIQYSYFGVNYTDFDELSADTHYAVPFISGGDPDFNKVDFGGSPDPDASFITAHTNTQYASQIVPMMWLITDDIAIDSVYSIEGSDQATGDVTRMHLLSYHFTPGSTSCLTSGTLLATNGDLITDVGVTNDGAEQAYLSTWTVGSPNVAATSGSKYKVILCFFRTDTTSNSDYSINVTVKYHLR
tara:strand:- start:295 stop:915 length:621 start_codon:yes stop_codon:yes gene_type:complete